LRFFFTWKFLMELVVYPAIYEIWKWNFEIKRQLLNPKDILCDDLS